MKIKNIAILAALALPVVASADDTKSGTKSGTTSTDKSTTSTTTDKSTTMAKLADTDLTVLEHQHHVDEMEISMGKLAQRNGGSAVKSFGETLVRDHSAADKESMAFAKKHNLAKIPADVPKTDEEKADQKTAMENVTKLKKLKGAEFDREFANIMAMDHDKEIAKLTAVLPMIQDTDFATMLRNKQPVLQRHADQAHELQRGNASASATDTSSGTSGSKAGTSTNATASGTKSTKKTPSTTTSTTSTTPKTKQ